MALRRLFYGLMLTVSLVFYGAYQQWVSFVLLIVAYTYMTSLYLKQRQD